MCRSLGVNDEVSSPTYNIVNEYRAGDGKIFHFDLYRLSSTEELYDIGMEEYLYSGSRCFIEWPGLAEKFFADDLVNRIEMERGEDEQRLIKFS
jgi:tRNA threonylcarbamoyladenosine biosynthesis protein TsaE